MQLTTRGIKSGCLAAAMHGWCGIVYMVGLSLVHWLYNFLTYESVAHPLCEASTSTKRSGRFVAAGQDRNVG